MNLLDLEIDATQGATAAARALHRHTNHDLTRPVVAYVADHAADHPEDIAVRDSREEISYAELLRRARRLAGVLRDADAAGRIVAVTGTRSANVVAAFLAIELAGAVYLPLDVEWPERRQRDVLRRSGAAIVLVPSTGLDTDAVGRRAASGLDCVVVLYDAEPVEPWSGDALLSSLDQLRYVVYTSGSTGLPKGALVEHRGMLNHLLAKIEDLALTRADRVTQTAPLGFDISLWQMLAPLVVGAQVEIIDDDIARDPARLVAELQQREITVTETVPTLLQLITEELRHRPVPLANLRWMLATGEELYPAVARGWLRTVPHCRLMNAYGPTECSDDVTHHVVTLAHTEASRLSIGSPIANTSLYVLTESEGRWRSCDVNETGELFVGGVGVGRGYLNDPERTAGTFFKDPFTPGGRLYRTGDLVRRTPEGTLEYFGRVDRQVKVAGVRMELGEIEAVLHTHPAVSACAVRIWRPTAGAGLLARETSFAEADPPARVVAYVTGDPAGLDPDALNTYCAERLPLTMVPKTFEVVPAIPLSHNGKVDYDALPAPARLGSAVTRMEYVSPVGEVEFAVAEAMGSVLETRIGRDDSFARLGGDSLRGMRVASTLRARGYQVTLRDILTAQTPRAVAARTTRISAEGPVRRDGHAPSGVRRRMATPYQAYLYDSWLQAKENPAFSYQGSLRMTGPVDLERLTRAWEALLTENPVLTARWFTEGTFLVHEFPAWDVPLPSPIDLSALNEQERDQLYRNAALAAATEPFDLAGAPPLRVQLFRFGDGEHRLLLTMHEIVLDGWGVTLLVDRLAELYGEATAGGRDEDRAHRYDDYLAWQEASLQDKDRSEAWARWRQTTAGQTAPTLFDRGTPDDQPTFRSSVLEHLISAERMDAVRMTCGAYGLTPFMVLLGAYTLALCTARNRDEITVLAPIANRDAPEQSNVLAFLLNFLALRIAVKPDDTVQTFLLRLKEVVANAYAVADCPTAWMCDSDTEFDVVLNLLTYPARRVEVKGVEFGYTVLDHGYTKTPCVLYGQEHWSGGLVLQLAYQEGVVNEAVAGEIVDRTTTAVDLLTGPGDTALGSIDPATGRSL
ncbi:non-ribosomal peptide synthetase [Amycolatopsis taiwanensis]|uniref:non-ribosomal peptide synthetase n=1 Tax=Amycolatopsis taiwanensis TaxID=342230 RepID=UPI0004BB9490|nr:non-ribosomal peptide synthetase [Amycolatopsis taiwanensis]